RHPEGARGDVAAASARDALVDHSGGTPPAEDARPGASARCWRDPGRLRGRRLPAPWGACVVERGARGRRGRARADAWSPRRLDRRGARLALLPPARLPVTSSAATHCRLREPTSRSAGCRTSLTEKVGELFGHAGVGRV